MTADNEELDARRLSLAEATDGDLVKTLHETSAIVNEPYMPDPIRTLLMRSAHEVTILRARVAELEHQLQVTTEVWESAEKAVADQKSQLQQVKADAELFQFLYDNWYSHLDSKPLYLWIEANLLRFGGLRNTLDSARRNDGTA